MNNNKIKFTRSIISPKHLEPKTIMEFIKTNYSISPISIPTLMKGGTENAGWFIYSTSRKYVAKIFSAENKVKNVNEEIRLYSYLYDKGIQVPRVIMTNNNLEVSQLIIMGRKYSLMLMKLEKLRRVSVSTITTLEINSIADIMAHMHIVLQSYPRKRKIASIHIPKSLSIKSQGFKDLLSSPNSSFFSKKELSIISKIESRLESYIKNNNKSHFLKKTVLHGDLSLGHMQFLPNGEVYLFDFSDFSFGPIVWDLSTLFIYFYKEGEISLKKWRILTRRFIYRYKQSLLLNKEDISAFKFFLLDRLLFEIRTLNYISRKDSRLVDGEGNKNRYNLADYLLNLSSDFLI